MNCARWCPASAPLPKRAKVTCGRNLRRSTSKRQLRATVETFCCSQSSRSLFSTVASRARSCLPLENCSTPNEQVCVGETREVVARCAQQRKRDRHAEVP